MTSEVLDTQEPTNSSARPASKRKEPTMSSKLPSVLSIQRGTIVTDGVLRNLLAKDREVVSGDPVRVIRHGIRGVLPKKEKDGVANPQRTESAKTCQDAIGLEVSFSLRMIPARDLPFSCSDPTYRQSLDSFIDRFFKRGVPEFDEVCRRYARNVFNGRWMWRNRVFGPVRVSAQCNGEVYQAEALPLHHFNDYTQTEERFASDVIATGLLGGTAIASVTGRILFGFTGEVEVFPSQNMVTGKPRGFARSLYKVNTILRRDLLAIMDTVRGDGDDAGEFAADMIDMGNAALRDQKIGNALRTIDTWYPGFDGTPIPIEPNGANLEANVLFRDGKGTGAKDLLTQLDDFHPSQTFDPRVAYLIALLIRGGVFSEKQ